MIVDLETSRIFELNRTAARFWEILEEEQDLARVNQRMLAEFDVPQDELDAEIKRLTRDLADKQLIAVG